MNRQLDAVLIRRELTVLIRNATERRNSLGEIYARTSVELPINGVMIINDRMYAIPSDALEECLEDFARKYLDIPLWEIIVAQTPPEVLNYWTA